MNSLLCAACSKPSNEKIVALLLKKGADVNAYNEDGMPALMLACTSRTDDTKPVEILIKHGADINAVNKITKFKKEYEALAPEYEIIFSLIDARNPCNIPVQSRL